MAPKRKVTAKNVNNKTSVNNDGVEIKQICKYGASCYRKNPDHRNKYLHSNISRQDEKKDVSVSNRHAGKVKENNKKPSDVSQLCRIDEDADKVSDDIEAKDVLSSRPLENNSNISQEVQGTCGDKETKATSSLQSSGNVRQRIKEKFLVEMPEDFYDFWEFCRSIHSSNPESALHSELGLILVGPYDELCGKLNNCSLKDMSEFLCHWRYYYDPPEFLTVMKRSGQDLFHIGYYRDNPSELPNFVAWNEAGKNCIFNPNGPNLFSAISQQIEIALKKTSDMSKKNKLQELKNNLEDFAKRKKHTLEKETKEMRLRKKLVVSSTFHKAGIVVKVDKNDVGYRPLPESNANLQKLLTRIAESKTEAEKKKEYVKLHELLTFVQFANDECDYGMGLELGLDLFLHGDPTFHKIILSHLPLSYKLLNKPEFGKIVTAHLQNRRSGEDLSVIS